MTEQARRLRHRSMVVLVASALGLGGGAAHAAPCTDLNPIRPIYGAGGSAVTATLKSVARALIALPEAERVTIFYHDPGACTGYGIWRTPDPLVENNFKYWDAAGNEFTCQAPQSVVELAYMGSTPALCPGDVPLPADGARFATSVQTINFMTHHDSQYEEISAEALYHIYGFGPGAAGKSVAPWTEPHSVFGRTQASFVTQFVAEAIRVPAAKLAVNAPTGAATNVQKVYDWGQSSSVDEPLAFASASAADAGADALQIKTLAYQHFDQRCAYLPDSSRASRDKLNVRTGQYALWTPGWFYTRVDAAGDVANDDVANLIGWFDGTVEPPDGVGVQEIIVASGDVPLCAMQVIRPDGDFNAVESYAPPNPCGGFFEHLTTGSTVHAQCSAATDCSGDGEACRFGFCEAY